MYMQPDIHPLPRSTKWRRFMMFTSHMPNSMLGSLANKLLFYFNVVVSLKSIALTMGWLT